MTARDADVEEMMRLISYIYRLYGSLRAHISSGYKDLKLAPLDVMTLGAVVWWPQSLTVAEIARMHNFPRQSILRSARALAAAGLIEFKPNPRHARAPLLAPTAEGVRLERICETNGRSLADKLRKEFPAERTGELADKLYELFEAVAGVTGAGVTPKRRMPLTHVGT
jgi:DNA-binding MarR family transcriptional regulator